MPKDQNPDPEDPRPEGDVAEDTAGSVGERRPPGPGDVPLSNLPPPGAEDPGEPGEPGDGADVADDAAPRVLDLDELAALVDDPSSEQPSPEEPAVESWGAPTAREAAPAEPAVPSEGEAVDEGPDDVPPLAAAVEESGTGADPVRPGSDATVRSRRTLVVALVAVAGLVVAFLQHQRAEDLESQRADRRAVERVADAFGSAYLSYDFNDPDRSARAVQALSTAAFAEAYAAQSAPGIQELFSSRQTTTSAETQEVFVGAVRRASARALVVVDVTATSPTDGQQELDGVSFVLDLARASGGWRVTKVVRAPQPALQVTPTTPTTAAPPASTP